MAESRTRGSKKVRSLLGFSTRSGTEGRSGTTARHVPQGDRMNSRVAASAIEQGSWNA